MRIVIDSPLWALGLKAPFLSAHDPILTTATAAQSFLRETLKKNWDLLFSSQLLAEIFEELTRKGTVYRPISQNVMERCVNLSGVNNIPVWDYLIAVPFEDQIDRIYTIDPHFEHSSLSGLAEIENPLGVWKPES
jgi:hypothetical protein